MYARWRRHTTSSAQHSQSKFFIVSHTHHSHSLWITDDKREANAPPTLSINIKYDSFCLEQICDVLVFELEPKFLLCACKRNDFVSLFWSRWNVFGRTVEIYVSARKVHTSNHHQQPTHGIKRSYILWQVQTIRFVCWCRLFFLFFSFFVSIPTARAWKKHECPDVRDLRLITDSVRPSSISQLSPFLPLFRVKSKQVFLCRNSVALDVTQFSDNKKSFRSSQRQNSSSPFDTLTLCSYDILMNDVLQSNKIIRFSWDYGKWQCCRRNNFCNCCGCGDNEIVSPLWFSFEIFWSFSLCRDNFLLFSL